MLTNPHPDTKFPLNSFTVTTFTLLHQEPYWIVLHDRIVSVISSPALTSETEWAGYPFALLDFTACHQSYSEMNCSYVLALAHAVWHHSSIGQLSLIPK